MPAVRILDRFESALLQNGVVGCWRPVSMDRVQRDEGPIARSGQLRMALISVSSRRMVESLTVRRQLLT